MPAPTQQQIDNAVRMVVDAVQPLRVVLFGSAVRGESRGESDVDLMVVMPDGADYWTTMKSLHTADYEAMRAGSDLPRLDFVFATPSLLAERGNRMDLVYGPAELEGVVVYAA